MHKRNFIISVLILLSIIISSCSTSKKIVKVEKPKVKVEEKVKPVFIKNLDFEERNFIKSEKINSIDKIKFVYDSRNKLTGGVKTSKIIYDKDGFMTEMDFLNQNGKVDQS